MKPGLGATNAHRLVRPEHGRAYCSGEHCTWHPEPGLGGVVTQFRRHLYELAPKRAKR